MSRVAPGILFLYLMYAVLLTIPVSLILIWWYRRAIGQSMAATAAMDVPVSLQYYPAASVSTELPQDDVTRTERRLRTRLAVVYILAGLSAAMFWTLLLFLSGGIDFTPLRGFAITYAYCWPIVPTLILLLNLDRRRSLPTVAAYIVLGVLTTILWSATSELLRKHTASGALTNGWEILRLIALDASVPGAIVFIAANRRIRGVFPLVLAALLVFTFSTIFANEFFIVLADHGGLRRVLLESGVKLWNLWFMLAAVPVGYFCWRLLIFLNRGFQHRSFSDQQLLVDSCWVIVAFAISADLAASLGWRGLWGLAGFAVYRSIAAIGLAAWRYPKQRGIRLLVLRVFGFQRRSEKLFDSVVLRWRFRGAVTMIAGTDLAARTIEPDDALAFASGNLPSWFVSNTEELEEHLSQIDEARDPDGRFRLTKLFCHKNTWMPALSALLGHSDIVLMDLRGFNKDNAGCLFELEQLAAAGKIAATVFLADSQTDHHLMSATLQQAASTVPPYIEQVNRDSVSARERVYRALQLAPRKPAG